MKVPDSVKKFGSGVGSLLDTAYVIKLRNELNEIKPEAEKLNTRIAEIESEIDDYHRRRR